jgi:hypothetical protein
MDGRKNKRAPTRDTSQQIPIGEPRPDLHPISFMILIRDSVFRFARSRKILSPKRVWQLPTETFRKFDSELMNAWWTQPVTEAAVSLPGRITAHSHKSGSSTVAFKLGVPVPVICQIADLIGECTEWTCCPTSCVCFRVERRTLSIQTDETCSPTACGQTVTRMGSPPLLEEGGYGCIRIAHGLCPETFGQPGLSQSCARHLEDGSVRTLCYAVGLGRVLCRAVYGYTATGGKLGNRSILSSVVRMHGIYLCPMAALKLAHNDLKQPSTSDFRFIANTVTCRLC